MRLNVNPLESVGDVKFGMTREEVRSIFGDDRCEAVEIFDAEVFIDGKQVYPIDMDKVIELLPDLEEDDIGPISYERSIGIYAPDDEMESILFGRDGYYD